MMGKNTCSKGPGHGISSPDTDLFGPGQLLNALGEDKACSCSLMLSPAAEGAHVFQANFRWHSLTTSSLCVDNGVSSMCKPVPCLGITRDGACQHCGNNLIIWKIENFARERFPWGFQASLHHQR